jgi:hypothetical protein
VGAQSVHRMATVRSSSPCGEKIFLFSTSSRSLVASHPASFPVETGGKEAGREADHSRETSAEVENKSPILIHIYCLIR